MSWFWDSQSYTEKEIFFKKRKALTALPEDSVSVLSIQRRQFRGLMSPPASLGTRHTMVYVHTCRQIIHTYIKNKIFNKKERPKDLGARHACA